MKPKSKGILLNHRSSQLTLTFSNRLVTHSPLPRSSSCSPVEYSDPHTSTLLQLLKNISEEVEDLKPTIAVGHKSPLATLNSKLQQLASGRSTSPNLQRGPMGNLIPMKAKSTSPPKVTKNVPTKKSISLDDVNDPAMKPEKNLGENLNLPVPESDRMMPLIQITLTESQEKKKFTGEASSSGLMTEGMVVNFLLEKGKKKYFDNF